MKYNYTMVQMLFFLRFRSQLRRTRPELVTWLEETITAAVFTAGGRLSDNRRFLNAYFDPGRIGFWLDMLILIETVHKALEKAGSELSGHAMVLNENIPEYEAERLCRSLSSSVAVAHASVWCGQTVRNALQSYCVFEQSYMGYWEMAGLKSFGEAGPIFPFPLREKVIRALGEVKKENVLLTGSFFDMRDGVYRFCSSAAKDIPPLIIRFNSGDSPKPGPVCFCDTLTPVIRTALASAGNDLEELDAFRELLFRERIAAEASVFLSGIGRRFFALLLKFYVTLLNGKNQKAFIIVEEPFCADEDSFRIFADAVSSLNKNRDEISIIGISGGKFTDVKSQKNRNEWNAVFQRIINFGGEDSTVPASAIMDFPEDLWEITYALSLLNRYFPAQLFPQIFTEEGLNPGILGKALDLLVSMGVIDSVSDPRPRIPEFMARAEKILRDRKNAIRIMIVNRLSAWEHGGKLRPSFNLLCVLNELGGTVDDALILRSFRCDINNKTCDKIGESFSNRYIHHLTKKENVRILRWIFNTQTALVSHNQNEIRKAFGEAEPDLPDSVYPGFRAQVLTNLCAYRFGIRDAGAAAEIVKKLMLLNQNLKDGGIPSYRYFSLLSLFKQKIDDTLEYSSFGMDLAEKSGREELVKASFFAASAHLLYGNLSGAQRFILKAEKTALDMGWPEWILRSRFFLGRLHFENGHYQDALDIFMSLKTEVPESAKKTLAAWIYRTRVYLFVTTDRNRGKTPSLSELAPDGANSDEKLFCPEAAFLLGNYEEAAGLAENLLAAPLEDDNNDDFFFTEQPDWRSGFSQCEYMLIPHRAFRKRLLTVIHILAQSSLPLSPEKREAVRERIQRLVREEVLPEGDACDVFCLYAWYLIMKRTGAPHGDASTALSIAYRRLQRRAGRNDSMECRQDYLSLNYWNNALCLAAKENMLV